MSRRMLDNSGIHDSDNSRKFGGVTRYLRHQDFKWLKEDMGFFELPEDWDPQFQNDNIAQKN